MTVRPYEATTHEEVIEWRKTQMDLYSFPREGYPWQNRWETYARAIADQATYHHTRINHDAGHDKRIRGCMICEGRVPW